MHHNSFGSKHEAKESVESSKYPDKRCILQIEGLLGWNAYQNLSKKASARQIRILIFFPYCEDDVFECNVD
jgi:hypothetical protein